VHGTEANPPGIRPLATYTVFFLCPFPVTSYFPEKSGAATKQSLRKIIPPWCCFSVYEKPELLKDVVDFICSVDNNILKLLS
jgi:hypothetical protein